MERFGELALIALGSNKNSVWGDPTATVTMAIQRLQMLSQTAVQQSCLYATPAFPADAGPEFVNAAVALRTPMPPDDLMSALHQIEADAGRERVGRWGQRTLDLDLLALGLQILPDVPTYHVWRNLSLSKQQQETPGRLILPHPRIQDRAFVLVPLADVAPDWVHPVSGTTVLEMLAECDPADRASVIPLS